MKMYQKHKNINNNQTINFIKDSYSILKDM